jgi:hypothetical protein
MEWEVLISKAGLVYSAQKSLFRLLCERDGDVNVI